MTNQNIEKFKKTVWEYYRNNKRVFPWRKTKNPYKILVSEIMLQQTQTDRVIPKYENWIKQFPDFETLANASLEKVLKEWQGLGYNRRGLNLKKTAEVIVKDFNSKLPKEAKTLESLSGIGPYTRGAIQAFAWNIPTPFIETNIRSAYIHYFFEGHGQIHDKELFPLIEETLDKNNPREWYYALMDFGSYLKKISPNPSRKSRHYTKQSSFIGSNREIRSKLLSYILSHSPISKDIILKEVTSQKYDVLRNLEDLEKEGFIVKDKGNMYRIR